MTNLSNRSSSNKKLVQAVMLVEENVKDIEAQLSELSASMEQLDENSKDFAEMDFEYNYLSGRVDMGKQIIQELRKVVQIR